MAESQDGQEKSEEPTAKRQTDAREKGQVPRSREFNTFFMMLASAAYLLFLGSDIIRGLLAILHDNFTVQREYLLDKKAMAPLFMESIYEGLWVVAPFFAVMVAVAIISSTVLGGWNFSIKSMAFKGSKMDPIKGTKRIFGPKGLVELLKAIGKVAVLTVVAVLLLSANADKLIYTGYQSMDVALANIGEEILWFFLILSASLIVIAAIDAPFQLWDNKNQLKMTKDEVKQEHKQTEGSPEVKQRIRAAQREMAQRRMMAEVPKADVVITNPTHFAVALKYDQENMGAPIVVAKGADLVAAKIREIAVHHNVPILSSPALARSIFYHTELNDQIPQGLYVAVAKILAYIFQLRAKPGTDFSRPIPFEDVSIPDDLRRDH